MAAAFAPKPKPQNTDFSTKTDAELDAAETSLSATGKNGRPTGFATNIILQAIKAERARRTAAKPPATPPPPDAAAEASKAASQAQQAGTRTRKRAAAGAAGFVRPLTGVGTSTAMAGISTTSLLGG